MLCIIREKGRCYCYVSMFFGIIVVIWFRSDKGDMFMFFIIGSYFMIYLIRRIIIFICVEFN